MRLRSGFTLIELMIAITIVAIVSSIGFVTYSTAQRNARDTRRKQDLRQIATALELYYQKNSNQFPAGSSMKDDQAAWSNLLSSQYINRMPKDPKGGGNYVYLYHSSDTSSYFLCALLENTSDPEITPVASLPPECPVSLKNFVLTSQ